MNLLDIMIPSSLLFQIVGTAGVGIGIYVAMQKTLTKITTTMEMNSQIHAIDRKKIEDLVENTKELQAEVNQLKIVLSKYEETITTLEHTISKMQDVLDRKTTSRRSV